MINNRKILSLILIIGLSLIMVSCEIILYEDTVVMPDSQMKVHFMDVGQGDSILIQHKDQNILIDGGDRGAGPGIVQYLESLNVNHLHIVISTHPHADHIGGLIEVLKQLTVEEVIDPGIVHTTKTFEDYLTLIDEKDIKFTEGRAGTTRQLGEGLKMDILHPVNPSSSHLNDASIVVRITFGEVSFMFTGDAEKTSEAEILERGKSLNSQILKMGHHGSSTSTSEDFLNKVSPEIAIIMVGAENRYGHPHKEILETLENNHIEVYRTDLHGTIIITTNGTDYQVETKK